MRLRDSDVNMTPPAIPVTRSSMPSFEEYVATIAPLWESRWLTNRGALHRELEEGLQEYLASPYLALFTNGHLALESILEAFDLKGDVVTTPFTFASTTQALVRRGLTPVFADVRSDNYTIDPEAIESAITPETSAILAVHVYGGLCDVEQIEGIARDHDLRVIYDAAHAFGATRHGQSAASFGDASMFSFHATKVFHTIEGGAAVVREARLVERLYQLQNFGISGPEEVALVGGNAKLDEFAAAMGLCNLQNIDTEIARRATVDAVYRENLSDVAGLYIPELPSHGTHNFAYFPVQIDARRFGMNRDAVVDHLREHGIGARKYFSPLTSEFAAYSGRFDPSETPIALQASREILTLPLYADLRVDEAETVCRVVQGLAR